MAHRADTAMPRRAFAQALLAGGSAALLTRPAWATRGSLAVRRPLPATPRDPDERFWEEVRSRFVLAEDLAPLNAANLCPSPAPVLERLEAATRDVERDPSPQNRASLRDDREATRDALAGMLRVDPEEIVITRNTSEANNFVSSGLDLGPGDEVVIFGDNHPSNHAAWREKARRFGYTVHVVEQVNPHPGAEHYVEAFARAVTPRTRVVAFTHVTNSAGDLLPAKDLCTLARERGALSLVDGAQAFGVLDVDLRDMAPDFYTGSAHKWPCGPKETGVLYVDRRVHERLAPSVVSLYAGQRGIARRLEGMGQRDEPAIAAFGEAVTFQAGIGLAVIEARARELTQALVAGLGALDGVTLWTHPDPARGAAVASFLPGSLDPRRLAQALYERDRIVCAIRGGDDRPGIRLSPHFYNLHAEIERTLAALRRYLRSGV